MTARICKSTSHIKVPKGRSAQSALIASDAAAASCCGEFRLGKDETGDRRAAGKSVSGHAAMPLGFVMISLAPPVATFRDWYKYMICRLLLFKTRANRSDFWGWIGPSGLVYEASGDAAPEPSLWLCVSSDKALSRLTMRARAFAQHEFEAAGSDVARDLWVGA